MTSDLSSYKLIFALLATLNLWSFVTEGVETSTTILISILLFHCFPYEDYYVQLRRTEKDRTMLACGTSAVLPTSCLSYILAANFSVLFHLNSGIFYCLLLFILALVFVI